MNLKRLQKRFGFSMVEVALAVLVLGVGVLTVVGLMSGSLQMNKNGEDDLQMTMFANDVMEGFRAAASLQTNAATALAAGLSGITLPPVAKTVWAPYTQGLTIKQGNAQTFTYALTPTNIDATFRYNLSIQPASATASVGPMPQNVQPRTAAVLLDVISGAYGNTVTQTFYTEIFQTLH